MIAKSDVMSETEIKQDMLAFHAAAEGMVLLKNNGVLPLACGKLALYGAGARHTIKGGTGSGNVNNRRTVSVEEGLREEGCTVTTQQWLDDCDRMFEEEKIKRDIKIKKAAKGHNPLNFWSLMEKLAFPHVYPSGRKVSEKDVENSATDTAIFVLSRQAGEGRDRRDEEGDYRLFSKEKENIIFLRKHYKKLVLIINTGSCMDMSILDELNIDAVIYMAQAGQSGGRALASLLLGKRNFSGKLTASWPYYLKDLPASQFYSSADGNTKRELYVEDIFVGYRFHDSFYKPARFPFGFGLSYTDFTIHGKVHMNGLNVIVETTVRNTGICDGKEVIQVYVSCPGKEIIREYQSLTAFRKTPALKPGECYTGELVFDLLELVYFSEEKSAFILEAGDYIVRLGNSSVSTEAVARIRVQASVITKVCCKLDPPKEKFEKIFPDEGQIDYQIIDDSIPVFIADTSCVKLLDLTKSNKKESYVSRIFEKFSGEYDAMTPEEKLTLLVGDPAMMEGKEFDAPGACGRLHKETLNKLGYGAPVMADGPAGLRLTMEYAKEPNGKIKMEGKIPEELLTAKRLFRIVNKIWSHTSARAEYYGQYCTAWPTETLLAQTFDTDLLYQIGKSVAFEMKLYGVDIWLAPGMNIQRYPLCGRNYEYYSEDPYLTGRMAAALTRGVQDTYGAVTIKHFCCNNQEDNRSKNSSEVSVRALREIYLKAFEYVIEAAGPLCLMTSYNMVNGVYVNSSYKLVTKVIREEWGYEGCIMTDWQSVAPEQAKANDVICAGGNLIMAGDHYQMAQLAASEKDGKIPEEKKKAAVCGILDLCSHIKRTDADGIRKESYR